MLAFPDACTRGESVLDPESRHVIASAPPLPENRLYPKEQALLDLVPRERSQGRRVLVYITHTESRDISPRLERILRQARHRVLTLKANIVAPDRREEWVEKQVRQGLDVLIVHPRLVQTGLDLIDFPTLVWYEVEYSVYTMRQASRRSWRIGQKQPVKVVFFDSWLITDQAVLDLLRDHPYDIDLRKVDSLWFMDLIVPYLREQAPLIQRVA